MSSSLTQLFAALDGARIPGGCDSCDAYQEVAKVGHVTHINVCHDDDCPVLANHNARRNHP